MSSKLKRKSANGWEFDNPAELSETSAWLKDSMEKIKADYNDTPVQIGGVDLLKEILGGQTWEEH